jgi:hypothetical protein
VQNIVRVWIGDPYKGGHFNGTAFFIEEDTLVTAKHVVVDNQNEVYKEIYLTNTPDGGVTPISKVIECKRDMVVLKVKKSFIIDAVSFSDEIAVGKNVNVVGYYDNNSSQKSYENRVSGYQNSENTYELQNHLTHGLSGSPVFLEGDICGVTNAINSAKNITYVIPISELCVELTSAKKEEQERDEPLYEVSLSLGIVQKIFNTVSLVSPPFVIILILFVVASKITFPNLELSDTIYALIFIAFVLAKVLTYVLKKFKRGK